MSSADAFGRDPRATPFVGRRAELDALQRAWVRAGRGFGSTVLIGGAAGIGKSRLAAEFSALVERQGGRVLAGLTAQPESAPYQALIAAAKRGLAALGRDRLDDVWAPALTGVLPEIRVIRPDAGNAEPLDAERSRVRLHEALATYFESIARGRPLVLLLEDVHWAGRDTIGALDALARRSAGAPLLILGTFRSEDLAASSGLHTLARRLRSEQRGTRTMLGPLRSGEIDEMVARTPVFAGAPTELPVAVARLSEGNPLFAWELLRSYEETQHVRNVYYTQVGNAELGARTVDAMFALADASKSVRWRIAALDARAYLHMVGSSVADAEAPLADAAALAQELGDDALHVRLAIRLANVQVRLGKAVEARALLQRRRAALETSSSPAEWLDLLNAEVNCFFVLEELEIGARAAEEQLALARRVGDVESENRAHSALAYLANVRGDAAAMREHSDFALAAFERTGHGRLLSVTLCNRGAAEIELGRIAGALQFWERAGAVAARAGARDVVATALIARAEAELLRERFETAAQFAAEALAMVSATGEERIIAEACVMRGAARCALGDNVPGLRDLREGVARHRAAGAQRSLPHALTFLLEALVRIGDLPAASEAVDELSTLDVSRAPYPARLQLALATFAAATGAAPAARRHRDEGRKLLRTRLAALAPDDAKAYRALPFSRALLHPASSDASPALR